MTLERTPHQKLGQPRRTAESEGEARANKRRDEVSLAGHMEEGLGRDGLLLQALSRENMVKAWKRVKANKGSAGVDGLTIEQTAEHLKTHWPRIQGELLNGVYCQQRL